MRPLLFILALAACSSPTVAPRDCTPGQTVSCDCPGGAAAVQVCGTDGRLGGCMCADAGEAIDTGSTTDSGACSPLQSRCNGVCVDLVSDSSNCGACNAPCAGTQICRASRCQPRDGGCAAGQMLCGAACVDVLTDNTNCGACGRVCGTSSRCVSGTCLEGDAGTVQDAGGMDAVVTPADVPATGTDALLGGDVVCRTPEQPILRRCNSDNDCESCAPFTSGLPWCCRGTGYCENTSACRWDAGRFVPDVQSACENLPRCREHADCRRLCLPRPNEIWCCGAGGECGTRRSDQSCGG